MDTASESAPELDEKPKKGDTFQVMDTQELREHGGLAVHDFSEEGGVLHAGSKHMEDVIVRMPVGTRITVERAFRDEGGTWVIFDYLYEGRNHSPKTLKVCALVEEKQGFTKKNYMEKVKLSPTGAMLEQLKNEIQGS